MTLVFCCWLLIDSHHWPQTNLSRWSIPWTTSVVTGCLISNIPLIFENLPCTCTSQLIDPWSIHNKPRIILLIVEWFASLTPDLLIPLTQYLVLCCCHWSYAIRYSSDFPKFSLHLHSTIDRPLKIPQLLWYSAVDCWLICVADHRSIACFHWPNPWYDYVVTGLLL